MQSFLCLLCRPRPIHLRQFILRNLSEYFPPKRYESMLPMPGNFKKNFKNPIAFGAEIPIDFYENENEIFIDADLPGIEKSNVEVTVDNTGTLHIHAKKNILKDDIDLNNVQEEPNTVMERVESEMKYYILERSADVLDRTIQLPADADRDFIKAKFTDGSLRISIPKFEGFKKERIEID